LRAVSAIYQHSPGAARRDRLSQAQFSPDSAWRDNADAGKAFGSIGAGHAPVAHSDDPMMHKTSTVDYVIVRKSETLLKAGDVLVQRGNTSFLERARQRALHHRRRSAAAAPRRLNSSDLKDIAAGGRFGY
jgi:hypothetical protein